MQAAPDSVMVARLKGDASGEESVNFLQALVFSWRIFTLLSCHCSGEGSSKIHSTLGYYYL